MTEWDAKAYSERNALQQWLADSHLGELRLDGTERALEIGCGDGKVTAEIARRLASGSVLGIDPSTRMISFAKAHFAGGTRLPTSTSRPSSSQNWHPPTGCASSA